MTVDVKEYHYKGADAPSWNACLVPPVMRLARPHEPLHRVLDVGCGNGYIAGLFARKGARVVGVDPSASGIEAARRAVPDGRFEIDLATPDLRDRLGEDPFDLVVSAEVAEHVYDPDAWAACCFNALRPGGVLILTTPYHGYLKNLAIALTNRWDHHHTTLKTGEHIKFWSRPTMTTLLERNGLHIITFTGAGRLPYLWRSMVVSAQRPEHPAP